VITVPLRVARRPSAGITAGQATVIIRTGTKVTFHRRRLASVPFMGSTRLSVIQRPTCDGALRATPNNGMLFLTDAPQSVRLRVKGGRIYVQVQGLRSRGRIEVAVKHGHRFVPQSLDRRHSLKIARARRLVTLRVRLTQGWRAMGGGGGHDPGLSPSRAVSKFAFRFRGRD
jgi:hypothetical protein